MAACAKVGRRGAWCWWILVVCDARPRSRQPASHVAAPSRIVTHVFRSRMLVLQIEYSPNRIFSKLPKGANAARRTNARWRCPLCELDREREKTRMRLHLIVPCGRVVPRTARFRFQCLRGCHNLQSARVNERPYAPSKVLARVVQIGPRRVAWHPAYCKAAARPSVLEMRRRSLIEARLGDRLVRGCFEVVWGGVKRFVRGCSWPPCVGSPNRKYWIVRSDGLTFKRACGEGSRPGVSALASQARLSPLRQLPKA